MLKLTGLCLFVLAVAYHLSVFAQSNAPQAAVTHQVTAFYRFHFAHDMAFTPEAVKARAAWLTPELRKICAFYFARPVIADQVPDIDGDSFTNPSQTRKNTQTHSQPALRTSSGLWC
jgi:hypothetical protein